MIDANACNTLLYNVYRERERGRDILDSSTMKASSRKTWVRAILISLLKRLMVLKNVLLVV